MTPHGRVLASPWSRIGARLLDGLLLAIVLVPIGVWGLDLDVAESAGSFSVRTPSAGALILIAVLGAAYEIIFTALKSATPGKMAVGIEIVRQSDGHAPLGFGTAAQRWLPSVVNSLNANLGTLVTLASLVLVFADKLRRSVFDFVGQTYVVNRLR
jgi:uncharacterized RDD family membrane protein YckC